MRLPREVRQAGKSAAADCDPVPQPGEQDDGPEEGEPPGGAVQTW